MYLTSNKYELQNNSSHDIIADCNHHSSWWWKNGDAKVRIHTARIYTNNKYCNCPGSEPGKIGPPSSHLLTCKHRKAKTVDITVANEERFGGYSLGVAP